MKIVDGFPIVSYGKNKNGALNYYEENGKGKFNFNLEKLVSELKDDENIIESMFDFHIHGIEEMIEEGALDKSLFYGEFFYKNFNKNNGVDLDAIFQETQSVIMASILLYKEIYNVIDLKNKKEIYLNYTRDIEFSLVYLIGLLIKKDFPDLDIITDKESLSEYLKSDNYNENNILDIKIYNNRNNENTFSENIFIDEEVKMKNTFSIYSDKVEVKI